MDKFLAGILAGFTLGVALSTLVIARKPAPKPPSPPPAIHHYNTYVSPTQKIQLRGTEIRSNGWCVEVLLAGRVDTIVCPTGVVVTETEETSGKKEVEF